MMGIDISILEVKEETLHIKTGLMTETEVEIKVIEEDLVGIEETVDLEIGVDSPLGIKVKTEGVIAVDTQDIL